MAKNLALSLRNWHKKNLIGENGGERKIKPSANPDLLLIFPCVCICFSDKVFSVIDCFSVPRYTYRQDRKKFIQYVLLSSRERSGSVVEYLTRTEGPRVPPSPATLH